MNKPTSEQAVQFLVQLQRLLTEVQFVATYKYALLMALADISVEAGNDSLDTLTIQTKDIAEKIIQYYWRQCSPYPGEKLCVFRQNIGKEAAIIRLVKSAKAKFEGSLTEACRSRSDWTKLLTEVDRIVRVMPLWKLQTVGKQRLDFLYENLDHGTSITLKPGIACCFRKFHGLVGELVRGAWSRYVRRFNQDILGDVSDLQEFMFGSERAELSMVAPVLREVQEGRCFYCERALQKSSAHIDHFIPWSRYPVDLGHNFVLAHQSCNSSKSDRLAATNHLEKWSNVMARYAAPLKSEFDRRDIICDLGTSVRITRWAYQQTFESGGLTWSSGNNLLPLEPGWGELLSKVHLQ